MVYAATESVLRYEGPKYFYIYDHVNEFSYVDLDTSDPIKESKCIGWPEGSILVYMANPKFAKQI